MNMSNVGKTMQCLPSPSHHHVFLGAMCTIPSGAFSVLCLPSL